MTKKRSQSDTERASNFEYMGLIVRCGDSARGILKMLSDKPEHKEAVIQECIKILNGEKE